MFSLKDIIPEQSEFRPLENSETKAEDLVLEIVMRSPQDSLPALLEEIKRYKSKVGSISDHLLLRNSEGIIDQARAVDSALKQAESSDVHFELASAKIEVLEDQFLKPYEGVEKTLKKLEQGYKTHSLAVSYLKFIKAKTHLVELMSKTIDVEQASEAYLHCYHMMEDTSFEGLKHFEDFREQVESAKKLISAECSAKLSKSLEHLSFSETKQLLAAFDNMQLMQVKIQEVANKAMRDNFSYVKEIFTDSLKLDESDLRASFELFHPRIIKVIDDIVVNSQKIWILEVAFFEKRGSLKEKDLVTLFMLYFGKLVHMLVQTFQKLIENKSKLPINYQMIFLSSGVFLKELESLVQKLFIFIVSHPNGSETNHITIETLESTLKKDLPALLLKEFESILTSRMSKFLTFRQTLIQTITSPSHSTLPEPLLSELSNQLTFTIFLTLSTPSSVRLIYRQVAIWMQGLMDGMMSIMTGDDLDDYDMTSVSIAKVSRCFKICETIVRTKSAIAGVVASFDYVTMPEGYLDLINSLGAMLASVGKKICGSLNQRDALEETESLEEICSSDDFYDCILALLDCRTWSNSELNAFCFFYRCRILLDQGEEDFTRHTVVIDDTIKPDLAVLLADHQPEEEAETLIHSQLKLYCG